MPDDDPTTTVGVMLALDLHLFSGELEELSDQSTKEAKMEKQLADLQERWAVVEWWKEKYGGDETGTVKLIKITDDGKYSKRRERASRIWKALWLRFLFLLPPSNLFQCLCLVLLYCKTPKQVFF